MTGPPRKKRSRDAATPEGGKRSAGGQRKPADPAYLERAALFHLQRFAASRAHLARVLRRKVARRGVAEGVSEDDVERWIEAVLGRMTELGYIDDRAYARMRARSLLRQGRPVRVVRRSLAEKGVSEDLIDEALDALAGEAPDPERGLDLGAAIRYVRRRRLGPARVSGAAGPGGTKDADRRRRFEKDLAAMARAGFSYDMARTVLDLPDEAALDELESASDAAGGD